MATDFVGPFEAQAIALELEHTKPPRPLTHDLMRNILQTLNVTIVKINVVSLKEATFHANNIFTAQFKSCRNRCQTK